jgi:GABA(A) receptor-associated protein
MTTTSKESFQKLYTFNDRCEQSKNIRAKYKDKIPVILHGLNQVSLNPKINKIKYLVHSNEKLVQFLHCLKKNLSLKPCDSLFLFINGKIPLMTLEMWELYEKECDNDGFLYIEYSVMETFG